MSATMKCTKSVETMSESCIAQSYEILTLAMSRSFCWICRNQDHSAWSAVPWMFLVKDVSVLTVAPFDEFSGRKCPASRLMKS